MCVGVYVWVCMRELCVMRGERVYCMHVSGTQPNTLPHPHPTHSSFGREGVWTPNEDMKLVPKISHGLNSCRGCWPHSCVRYDVIAAQTDGWVPHRGVDVDFIRQQLLHSLQWHHAWNGDTGRPLLASTVHSQPAVAEFSLLYFAVSQHYFLSIFWLNHCLCSCCRVFGFKQVLYSLSLSFTCGQFRSKQKKTQI